MEAQYQRQSQVSMNRNLQKLESYSARNLVNLFYNPGATTNALKFPVPKGAILNLYNASLAASSFRVQGNYNHVFNRHEVNSLAGAGYGK